MSIVKRDMNELRFNSIFLLPKDNNPNYYSMLFKNTKAFFYGVGRDDLVEQLDFIIREKIEKVMGTEISHVLMVYKNLPTLNSFTRSNHPLYQNINIYKYTMQSWLEEIEDWVFRQVMMLEPEIRFTLPSKQFI